MLSSLFLSVCDSVCDRTHLDRDREENSEDADEDDLHGEEEANHMFVCEFALVISLHTLCTYIGQGIINC